MSLLDNAARVESLAVLSGFRTDFYRCVTARADALFELTDALLCTDGPVKTLVDLALAPEHRRSHGMLYDGLGCGRIDVDRLRVTLAGLPLPRATDGRIMLAVDVSPWLRSDAPTSAERLFCHVYGRAKHQAQLIPGWPYSFVAALEPGRTSWTAVLDAVRLGPTDDATAVTAGQLRAVVGRLTEAGHWHDGDPDILIVCDAGYDVTRLAFVLADLPVELLGRIRSDRVLRLPRPPRLPGTNGRPPKHGPEFALDKPNTWPEPQHTTTTATTRYGTAKASSWDRLHPRLTTVPAGWTTMATCRSWKAPSSGFRSSTCPATETPSRCGCGPRPPVPPPPTSTAAGSPSFEDSTLNTRSGCSSRPWAGPPRRSASLRPLTAGPGSSSPPTPSSASRDRWPMTCAVPGRSPPRRIALPRPGPPRVSEPPCEDRPPGRCAETRQARPWTPTRLQEPQTRAALPGRQDCQERSHALSQAATNGLNDKVNSLLHKVLGTNYR